MKDNENISNNPLDLNYFDDTLNIFYDNLKKNEELYNEIHDNYKNNSPTGFSLGAGRNTVELAKVLSSIRSTAIQGATALFNAKKSIAEIELKKRSQDMESEKNNDSKEFIREAIEELNRSNYSRIENNKEYNINKGKELLDNVINEKINSGEIKMSKNDLAMKYDFNNNTEVVFDENTNSPKVVKKGTNNIINDYPIERAQLEPVVRVDVESKKAYCKDGRILKIVKCKDKEGE